MWLWSLHLETLSCDRPGSDGEAGGEASMLVCMTGGGVGCSCETKCLDGGATEARAARGGQVEGKRVLAL